MVENPESRLAHGGAAAALSRTAAPGKSGAADGHRTLGDAWLDRRGRARNLDPSSLHGREARKCVCTPVGPRRLMHVFSQLLCAAMCDCVSLPNWLAEARPKRHAALPQSHILHAPPWPKPGCMQHMPLNISESCILRQAVQLTAVAGTVDQQCALLRVHQV